MSRAKLATAFAAVALTMAAGASDYEDAWGPALGATLPAIAATDQHGAARDLANLQGEGGLLLFVVRSADW